MTAAPLTWTLAPESATAAIGNLPAGIIKWNGHTREKLPDKALVPLTLGQCRQVRQALRLMAAESRAPVAEAANG